MEFSTKEQIKSLDNAGLLREAEILRKMANKCREGLLTIKEEANKRVGAGTMEMYDGDFEMGTDRELLKEAIQFLVRFDEITEERMPEWRCNADFILEVGDFYNKIENDDELKKCLA